MPPGGTPEGAEVLGIVLAAGGGTRMGRPKALMSDAEGVPWLRRAVTVLEMAGAEPVFVTLGAGFDAAVPLVPEGVRALRVPDWHEGIGASLRTALEAASQSCAGAALVTLVDLPSLHAGAAQRVVAYGIDPGVLRRATYSGRPGHPVLLGRDHWRPLLRRVSGDAGARDYLREHTVELIDCTDYGGGDDIDTLR
ncbi:nucleotidyltransferase family protein [Pseudactinotalea sp.]|uniref:nucleotidyltransferase family protein n=1 Tax=Pseudactinotalea sp. TaxID=1926260 RepID=UPI003B3A7285